MRVAVDRCGVTELGDVVIWERLVVLFYGVGRWGATCEVYGIWQGALGSGLRRFGWGAVDRYDGLVGWCCRKRREVRLGL